MSKRVKTFSEEEIDRRVIADADNDSSWGKPVRVRKSKSSKEVEFGIQEAKWIKKQVESFRTQLGSSGDDVFAFFICFSKFECALKQAGYKSWNEEKKELSPNWRMFAGDIAPEFDKQGAEPQEGILNEAVRYFLDNPPKKQVLKDGQIDWKDVEYNGGSKLRWLIDAIKRVRNNLFHGGKYPFSPIEEPARDSMLLTYGLVILQECLALCRSEKLAEEVRNKTQRVRESFEEPIK